eukprot:gnl/TRDRNA2_/TRDRNA2_45202_c0_seq1.p1 gnl/TRDRNA2_/TRDRNA2_45202_c0~~gnl/TRDRNA2_/TRDRNA2_45202_c0_seq1.p1  ORF type:complete len:192 (+),score=38.20 gnl/TRDRNA2_/TRDRNA2_45202_c0_seq1:45-620(+)
MSALTACIAGAVLMLQQAIAVNEQATYCSQLVEQLFNELEAKIPEQVEKMCAEEKKTSTSDSAIEVCVNLSLPDEKAQFWKKADKEVAPLIARCTADGPEKFEDEFHPKKSEDVQKLFAVTWREGRLVQVSWRPQTTYGSLTLLGGLLGGCVLVAAAVSAYALGARRQHAVMTNRDDELLAVEQADAHVTE